MLLNLSPWKLELDSMDVISFLPSYYLPVVLLCTVIFLSKLHSVVVGIVGLQHTGLLVHRTARSGPTVSGLDLWRTSQLLLDDRLLQPTGLPDSHETGTHSCNLPAQPPLRSRADGHVHTCTPATTHTILHWWLIAIYINVDSELKV